MDKELEAEYVAKMKECQLSDDGEVMHSRADDLICELLTKLGYEAVVKEWDAVLKWYH